MTGGLLNDNNAGVLKIRGEPLGDGTLIPLFQSEALAVAIEHQCLARHETNFQYGSRIFISGLGNTADKRVVFKHSRPYCRETVSLPRQFHTQIG